MTRLWVIVFCLSSLQILACRKIERVQDIQSHRNERIVGGFVAYAGQFPYTAAIYITTPDGTYFCAGALLNPEWVITAGQCVDRAVSFVVYLGVHNLKILDSEVLALATDNYVLHPEFNGQTFDNDIGLIKFRAPITFTDYIKPIAKLPTDYLAVGSSNIQSMGWGQPNDSTPGLHDELKFILLSVLSNDECRLVYGNQVTDNMLCAASGYNGGSCVGDTGNPLTQFGGNHLQSTLVGISSFLSHNGCESTDPTGFIRILPYVNWIRNITINSPQ